MTLTPQNTTVGFIGTGVMGKSMAGHLLKAGYRLNVYTRTKARAQELIDAGAGWLDSSKTIAQKSNVIITMVGYPSDVESVYLGPDGIISNARKDSYAIDMTTSDPSLAAKIYDQAKTSGVHALDAPVSGGDLGAREARLSIMVGGDKNAYEAVVPVLEVMGKNIMYQGPAGCGQHTKMANQIAIASTMIGVCEALAYAKKSGLDVDAVLKSISGGAAGSWSLSNLAPRIMAGNFAPGFYVKHFIKDMKIAIESAQKMKLDLPGLQLAKKLYDRLASEGGADFGTQALYKLYDL
jgi:3-hydroxyisobutyrate dehydrogenase